MSTATFPVSAAFRASTPATRLHLTRRGRVVFTTLAAIPLVAGALFFAVNGGGAAATNTSSTVQFHYVTVQSGQSLWSIATNVAPSADPRDVIAEIVSLNQLQSAVVTPGQRVAIPAQYASASK
ncbi:MAG: LysM peptidoglycan-binding protein [Leifsonia sp.]|jgi:hypothetical protein|nr:LysM peptidoglycan-binding protein [Leifsonia sp.]HEV7567771.1 LysM peptidoglycan-binding domain-containing protein [Microbacteriaceae bacterium]